MEQRARTRVRPWIALKSFVQIMKEPDDTAAGARLFMSLMGGAEERIFERFQRDPVGAKIIAERRCLIDTLRDRESLKTMPDGSLGRAYLDFMEHEDLSPDGLATQVIRSSIGLPPLDSVRELVSDRIRDTHDLFHVLLGYDRDIVGEVAVVAFTHVQLRSAGTTLLLPLNVFGTEFKAPGTRKLARDAMERARGAAWLPAQDWEQLLPQPLDRVREAVRVGPPPTYVRVWSEAAREARARHVSRV